MQDRAIRSRIPRVYSDVRTASESGGATTPGETSITLSPFWMQLVIPHGKYKFTDFHRLTELVELDTTGVVLQDLLLLVAIENHPIWPQERLNLPEGKSFLSILEKMKERDASAAAAAPAE